MGISGLLPFVKKACHEGNISELAGLSVAVDASCLLHRGMFGCMDQVATGEETNFYVFYVRKYINALLEKNCHVIMVFDGRRLPAKKDTNAERQARREENLSAGHALLSQGKLDEASEKFKRATHITREVVESTIKFFRSFPNVDIIVAPYEADAELAYLSQKGLIDAVITQDSDLIVFGCNKIFFKWDFATGSCVIYDRSRLEECFPAAFKFTFEKFRRVCILSGCDYLQAGLPGVGINKALAFFTKTSQTNPRLMLKKVPFTLRMPKLRVSDEFVEEFIRAENTFLHQVVFDPISRIQLPITPYPMQGENKENIPSFLGELPIHTYAGEVLSPTTSIRLALGNYIDGKGMLDDIFLLSEKPPKWSIWSSLYKSLGTLIRCEAKTENQQEPDNNAFQFDFSDHRVKKQEDIQVKTTPGHSSIQINSSIKKTSATRRLRNEAALDWTVDDMLRMYSSQPTSNISYQLSSQRSSLESSTQQPSGAQARERKRKHSAEDNQECSDSKDSCDLFSDPEPQTDTHESSVDEDPKTPSSTTSNCFFKRTREIFQQNATPIFTGFAASAFKRNHHLTEIVSQEGTKRKYRSLPIGSYKKTLNDDDDQSDKIFKGGNDKELNSISRQTTLTNIKAFGFRSTGLSRNVKDV